MRRDLRQERAKRSACIHTHLCPSARSLSHLLLLCLIPNATSPCQLHPSLLLFSVCNPLLSKHTGWPRWKGCCVSAFWALGWFQVIICISLPFSSSSNFSQSYLPHSTPTPLSLLSPFYLRSFLYSFFINPTVVSLFFFSTYSHTN